MTKKIILSTTLPILFSIFISIFFIPILSVTPSNIVYSFKTTLNNSTATLPIYNTYQSNFNTKFVWPTPGYTKITSKFGYRNAPTAGAGTYHGGVDIASPEDSSIISIADGIVTLAGWNGATGYTVIVSHSNNIKSIYGHVSPNFLVSVGMSVKKGELIAKVGPKYVSKTSYTTYTDKSGKYTNGATTRTTLTFCYK